MYLSLQRQNIRIYFLSKNSNNTFIKNSVPHCDEIGNSESFRIKKLNDDGWRESREAFIQNGNLPLTAIAAKDFLCHPLKKREV